MPSDDEFDQQLRRTAQRSMDDRSTAVDVDAALSDHQARHATAPRSGGRSRDRRWSYAAAAALVAVVAGAAVAAWPRGDANLDTLVTDTVVAPSSSTASSPTPSPTTNDTTKPPSSTARPATQPTTAATTETATAQATPSTVRPGGTVEITPPGSVERTCSNIVTVSNPDDGAANVVGQIVGGEWVAAPSDGSPVTYPACLGTTSAEPISVTFPTDMPTGDFNVCITAPTDPAGCAIVTIEPPPTGADICTTEPLTPPSLVDGSPPGEPTVEERDGGGALVRWGAADSPFAVSQVLGSTIDTSWMDGAITSEREFVAGDWLATTVPVGDPPISGIGLYLRDTATGCDRAYFVGPGLYGDQAESLVESWIIALSTGTPIEPIGHSDLGVNYFARRITPFDEPSFAIDELSVTGEIISALSVDEIAALLETGPLSDGSTVRLDGNPPQERCTNRPLVHSASSALALDQIAARSIAATPDGTLLATRDVCPEGTRWGNSETFSELVAIDPSALDSSAITLRTWPSDPDQIVVDDGNRIIALGEFSLGDVSPTGRFVTMREQVTSDVSRWIVLDLDGGGQPLAVPSTCPSDIAGPLRFVDDNVVVAARRCATPEVIDGATSDLRVEAVELSAGNVLWSRPLIGVAVNEFRRAVDLSAYQDDDGTIWALVAGNGGLETSSRTVAVSRDETVEITRLGLQEFAFDPADLITEFDSPPAN